jgi:hypothetical protein
MQIIQDKEIAFHVLPPFQWVKKLLMVLGYKEKLKALF